MYGEGEMSSDSADVGCHGCMVHTHNIISELVLVGSLVHIYRWV